MTIYESNGAYGGSQSTPYALPLPSGMAVAGRRLMTASGSLVATDPDYIYVAPGSPTTITLPTGSTIYDGRLITIFVTGATSTNYASIVATTEVERIEGTGYVVLRCNQTNPSTAAHWNVLHVYEGYLHTTTLTNLAASPPTINLYLTRNNKAVTFRSRNVVTGDNPKPNTNAVGFTAEVPARFRPATLTNSAMMAVACTNAGTPTWFCLQINTTNFTIYPISGSWSTGAGTNNIQAFYGAYTVD